LREMVSSERTRDKSGGEKRISRGNQAAAGMELAFVLANRLVSLNVGWERKE
jgi:hypothetical protein